MKRPTKYELLDEIRNYGYVIEDRARALGAKSYELAHERVAKQCKKITRMVDAVYKGDK